MAYWLKNPEFSTTQDSGLHRQVFSSKTAPVRYIIAMDSVFLNLLPHFNYVIVHICSIQVQGQLPPGMSVVKSKEQEKFVRDKVFI